MLTCLLLLYFRNGKRPPSLRAGNRLLRTEGERISRYHLWFAVSSRSRPHGVPTHPCAVTGAPGTRLLRAGTSVRASTPRCIRRPPPAPFHQPGALLRETLTGTGPLHHCREYSSRQRRDCQHSYFRPGFFPFSHLCFIEESFIILYKYWFNQGRVSSLM